MSTYPPRNRGHLSAAALEVAWNVCVRRNPSSLGRGTKIALIGASPELVSCRTLSGASRKPIAVAAQVVDAFGAAGAASVGDALVDFMSSQGRRAPENISTQGVTHQ